MIQDRRYGLIYIFLGLWAGFVARQRDISAAYIVAAAFLVLGVMKLVKFFKERSKE